MITEISTGFKVEQVFESLCESLIILLETWVWRIARSWHHLFLD